MIAFGILLSPGYFRLTRTAVQSVRNELYVDAARVSGLSDARHHRPAHLLRGPRADHHPDRHGLRHRDRHPVRPGVPRPGRPHGPHLGRHGQRRLQEHLPHAGHPALARAGHRADHRPRCPARQRRPRRPGGPAKRSSAKQRQAGRPGRPGTTCASAPRRRSAAVERHRHHLSRSPTSASATRRPTAPSRRSWTTSPSTSTGARSWASWASPARASPRPRSPSWACCRTTPWSPAGPSRSTAPTPWPPGTTT